jgi:hypothetical protein
MQIEKSIHFAIHALLRRSNLTIAISIINGIIYDFIKQPRVRVGRNSSKVVSEAFRRRNWWTLQENWKDSEELNVVWGLRRTKKLKVIQAE